jgi:5-methylcytosine-specific restriction endonuclease McrA
MSRLGLTRDKIYRIVARQLHGVVPCWVCGEHVSPETATLEHMLPISLGGSGHAANLAISHAVCNAQRQVIDGTAGQATAAARPNLPGQVKAS